MPDVVRTKIREAVKYGLGTIDAGGSIGDLGYTYSNTLKKIYSPVRSPMQMKDFPAVNVSFGPEDCENFRGGRGEGANANDAKLINTIVLILDCYMKTMNDTEVKQETILGDIQAYFGAKYFIPDSSGDATVLSSIYRGSAPFGMEANKSQANCGITIEFYIRYRQRLTNPTILS